MSLRLAAVSAALAVALVATGCGLDVQSPDLFVLTRTGEGTKLTLLVNDGGTVRCNGGRTLTLPDPQLLAARDLATSLDNDVKSHEHFAATRASVYRYSVVLQDGTLTFPDTAGDRHSEIAQAEQFTLQVAENTCK